MTGTQPGWVCPNCSVLNGEQIWRCATCGTRRPADTPVTSVASMRRSAALESANQLASVAANDSLGNTLRRHLNTEIAIDYGAKSPTVVTLVTVSDDAFGVWIDETGIIRVPFSRLGSLIEAAPATKLVASGVEVAILVQIPPDLRPGARSWFAGIAVPLDTEREES